MKTSLFLALFFVFCSCKNHIQHSSSSEYITLIFDSVKSNYDTLSLVSGGEMIKSGPVLSFKSENIQDVIPAVWKLEVDTISYKIKGGYIAVYYRSDPINEIEFIIQKGDTVLINEKAITPYTEIINRETKPFEGNYEYYKKARYASVDGYDINAYLKYPHLHLENGISPQQGREEAWQKHIQIIKDETIWLDSLIHSNMISEAEYSFFKAKNNFHLLEINLSGEITTSENLLSILEEYSDSLFVNDNFQFYQRYYRMVLAYYLHLTEKNADPKMEYDYLDNWGLDLGLLKVWRKADLIQLIIEQSPIKIAREYYTTFIEEVSDTVILNYFDQKYAYLFDETLIDTDDMEFINTEEERSSFSEILNHNKGKLVYVDFWASWCMPCFAEMPAAKEIRKKYQHKDIAFVYLSIYDEKANWENAIKKALLDDVKDNYFILNSKDASLVKELNINTIPRYLLYDQEGNLVYRDAPRPGSPEIEAIFEMYLK